MLRLALLGLCLSACTRGVEAPRAQGPAPRVVAIGPGTEANLFAIGLGELLVGVSDFCPEPAAAALPRVGGQADPNLERIAALAPTVLLVQGGHPRVEGWCRGAGVEFRGFATDSLAGWRAEIRWLGERFARSAESERCIAEVDGALARLRGAGAPRRTLLVVARRADQAAGVMAAGAGTFLSELLEAAGGVNVMPPGGVAYPSLNEESLIRLDPEAVIEFRPGAADDGGALAIWRRDFPALSASRDGRVGAVLHAQALMPGPRMHEVAQAMQALIQ